MPFYVVKTPNNEGEATAFSPGRHFACASDGTLWCCYAGPDGGGINQIFLSFSLDDGVTWTELPAVTAAARDQENPSIAIDSLDNINIVWHGQIAVADWEIYFCQRHWSGVWGALETITAVVERQRSPSIAIDSADNVHIVWVGNGWGVNVLFRNVQYRMRTAAGVWQAQEPITDIASHQLWDSASIAIDAANIVHVVWSGLGWGVNVADNNIQYRQRAAGVWGVQEPVTDLATWNHMPCIALDLTGNVHIAWYAETLWGAIWDIFYGERIAGVWQAHVQLTNEGGSGWDQYQPSIAIDTSDDVHIVFHGNGWGVNTLNYNLQYFKRTGGVWGAREALTDRAFDQGYPSLIWAFHPTVGGVKPNVLDNYLFVFTGQNEVGVLRVEFFTPAIAPPPPPPPPFRINRAFALSREEL